MVDRQKWAGLEMGGRAVSRVLCERMGWGSQGGRKERYAERAQV